MSFDYGNRDPKRHNIAWKNHLNAARFAATVSDLCMDRYAEISPSTPMQIARDYLAVARKLEDGLFIHVTSAWVADMKLANERFEAIPAAAQETRALIALVEIAVDLYLPKKRSASSIANEAGRWVYTHALNTTAITEAEIEQFEIQHRIADRVTPPSDNCRHAFEAVWALGKFRDAIKLLHRKER